MESVSMDVKGPLRGKIKYFLTMKDSFSNYFVAKPMTKVSAESTVRAMQDIFATLGIPKTTDNGTNFRSQKAQDYCTSRSIFLEFSAVSNPQENIVERSDSHFGRLLPRLDSDSWEKSIVQINSTPCRTLANRSPFSLFFSTTRMSNPIFEHRVKMDHRFAENSFTDSNGHMDKILKTKKQRLSFQNGVKEVWVRDFGFTQGRRYRQIENPELVEITASTVAFLEGHRFRNLSRNHVIFVPKLCSRTHHPTTETLSAL